MCAAKYLGTITAEISVNDAVLNGAMPNDDVHGTCNVEVQRLFKVKLPLCL